MTFTKPLPAPLEPPMTPFLVLLGLAVVFLAIGAGYALWRRRAIRRRMAARVSAIADEAR